MKKLWCDLRSDAERSDYILSGQAYDAGVIAHAIQADVALAFHRCSEYGSEVRQLREENERLRKDAEVGAAIQRAAAELPARYIIGISVEADAATVELCFPTGHIKTMDVDGDNRLAAEINAAIDAAVRQQGVRWND